MSKMRSLVLAVFLAVVAGAPTAVRADDIEGATDRPGSDYRRIEIEPGSISGASICRGFCVTDGNCTAWTFVVSGVQGPRAQCYLKAGTPAAVRNPCCQSGLVAHAIEPNIDRPGMDYSRIESSEPVECQDQCDADVNCVSWTFVRKGVQKPYALCYLKNGTPQARANDCCTSGVKNVSR